MGESDVARIVPSSQEQGSSGIPSNTSPTPNQPGRWIVSQFGGTFVLKWTALDIDRELSVDEVLVRVICAGIGASDNMQRVGGYPDSRCIQLGFTPGYGFFFGEVVRHGPTSTTRNKLAVGDLVASMCTVGAHATHVFISSKELIRIEPQDDTIKTCALPLNYMTAWGMLKRTGVEPNPGDAILIGSASGGLGTAETQLVQAFDLTLKMIGTCSPTKFEYVRSLGIIPIDRFAPDLVDQIRSKTGSKGVDVAYDAVGSKETLLQSFLATKKEVGRVVVIGMMDAIEEDGSGLRWPAQELPHILQARMPPRTTLYSVVLPDGDSSARNVFAEDFLAILHKARTAELIPKISRLYRLQQAVEAHKAIISGSQVGGKMIYFVDGELTARYSM